MASFTGTSALFHIPSISSPIVLKKSGASVVSIANYKEQRLLRYEKPTVTVAASSSGSSGLYSADQFELTPENVDMVLDDVRPYLISDGGNVEVVSVENGVVSLKLQGLISSYLLESQKLNRSY